MLILVLMKHLSFLSMSKEDDIFVETVMHVLRICYSLFKCEFCE